MNTFQSFPTFHPHHEYNNDKLEQGQANDKCC